MYTEKLECISDYQQVTGRHAVKDAILILAVIAYRYVVL